MPPNRRYLTTEEKKAWFKVIRKSFEDKGLIKKI